MDVNIFNQRRSSSTQIVPLLTFGDKKEEYEGFQELFEQFNDPAATTKTGPRDQGPVDHGSFKENIDGSRIIEIVPGAFTRDDEEERKDKKK